MTKSICGNCDREFCPFCDAERVPVTAPDKLAAYIAREAAKGVEDDGDVPGSAYDDAYQDTMSEVRSGEFETGLPTQYSRHYECKEVAALIDGEWIGWPCWFGGGKHGEPGTIDWIGDAYFLDCVEEMRPVKVFTKRGT